MVGLADFSRDANLAVGVECRLHGVFLLVLSRFDKPQFICGSSSVPALGGSRVGLLSNLRAPKLCADKAARPSVRPSKPSRHSKSIRHPPKRNPDRARR